ncbi:MAG: hypothetical protein FJX00_02485 [Alphaproteobacteria bacterium]|nr:hypothetical protein [Alphaproteobacteria bacterium]
MSKHTKKETNKESTKTKREPVHHREGGGNPMVQWIKDLEIIFEKAMQEEKLNIALKAKELLARSKGWIARGVASTPQSIKSIDQWTLQEVHGLIAQLDAYGNSGDGNEGNSGRDLDGGTRPWRTTEPEPDPKDPHREGHGTQALDWQEDPAP